MTDRSLAECYRIVAEAVNTCSVALPPIDASEVTESIGSFQDLGFDSLAFMEFCIAIHVETGMEISVAKLDELGSPNAVARYLSGMAA